MHRIANHGVSRFNGENIAGAAILFLSFLFLIAGTANAVFALIYPVCYLLAAIGIALVALGYRTWRVESGRIHGSAGSSRYRNSW